MIRKLVAFYNVYNGHATYLGSGKEITLNNGNCYAIIDGVVYKQWSDGFNTSEFIKLG